MFFIEITDEMLYNKKLQNMCTIAHLNTLALQQATWISPSGTVRLHSLSGYNIQYPVSNQNDQGTKIPYLKFSLPHALNMDIRNGTFCCG